MTLDVHILNKNTLSGFRSLFTFTGSLIMSINSGIKYSIFIIINLIHCLLYLGKESFEDFEIF